MDCNGWMGGARSRGKEQERFGSQKNGGGERLGNIWMEDWSRVVKNPSSKEYLFGSICVAYMAFALPFNSLYDWLWPFSRLLAHFLS